ncbi:MAG: hypothetical protein FJ161_01200, partial [Gammaproteobacteria bacterium]|nr:hypothetical protein [Gammaproteobacteria bacterium]
MLKSTLAAQHGRRKSCVANAYISQGTGQLEVRRSFTARDALNARRAGKDRSSLKTRLSVNEYFE